MKDKGKMTMSFEHKKDNDLHMILRYDRSNLAPEAFESSPELYIWTTANDQKVCKKYPITFKDPLTEKSEFISVSIDLKDISNLREDDTVRFEVLVLSPNQEQVYVKSKAGTGTLYLSDLKKMSLDESPLTGVIELRVRSLQDDDGNDFLKGVIEYKINNERMDIFDGMSFERDKNSSTKYYINKPEKQELLDKVIGLSLLKNYIPFTDNSGRPVEPFLPSHEEIECCHINGWSSGSGMMPEYLFWLGPDFTNNKPDESFYLNLFNITLDRWGWTPEKYNDVIEKQFNQKEKHLSCDFIQAIGILSDALVLPAISMPYIGDYVFTAKRSDCDKNSGCVDVESFQDAFRFNGGDCEDLGRLVYGIALAILYYNNWKSSILNHAKMILGLYVHFGICGSVTGAYLGQKKAAAAPIINSDEDNNIKPGYHMFGILIPLKQVLKNLCFTNKKQKEEIHHLFDNSESYAWESELPVKILEGTGWMEALLKPVDAYYSPKKKYKSESDFFEEELEELKEKKKKATGEERERIKKDISELNEISVQEKFVQKRKKQLEARVTILSQSKKIPCGQLKTLQNKLQQNQNEHRRTTSFYRRVTHVYTDYFLRLGYNISSFLFVLEKNHRWYYGVNLEEIIYNEDIGLFIMPGYLPEEFKAANVTLRQEMPWVNPTVQKVSIYSSQGTDITKSVESKIIEFKKSLTNYVDNFKKDDSTVIISYRPEIFMKTKFFEELVCEIKNNKAIMHVSLKMDYITDVISWIRLEYHVTSINPPYFVLNTHFTPQTSVNKLVTSIEYYNKITCNKTLEHFEFYNVRHQNAFELGMLGEKNKDILHNKYYKKGMSLRQNMQGSPIIASRHLVPSINTKIIEPRHKQKIDQLREQSDHFVVACWKSKIDGNKKYASYTFDNAIQAEIFKRVLEGQVDIKKVKKDQNYNDIYVKLDEEYKKRQNQEPQVIYCTCFSYLYNSVL
jgi:hypothetical protein